MRFRKNKISQIDSVIANVFVSASGFISTNWSSDVLGWLD